MAIEGCYSLDEIFQGVNFDFSVFDDGFGETLCIPDDSIESIGLYGIDFGTGKKEEEKTKNAGFPRTPEREEESSTKSKKRGFDTDSSSSLDVSEDYGVQGSPIKKRRKNRSKRGSGGCVWSQLDVPVVVNGGRVRIGARKCSHCGAEKTPQWRMGPNGPKTLCNACGVRYRSGRLVPEYRPAASPSFDSRFHSNSHKRIVKMITKAK